ncbi:hypothetical protein KO516_08645 [Citreicella sp. C3M06]|uniref:hypothetical protein n=1 Tax=Roseobacteraceae TaxID=2854170 RepID=UPI001C09AE6B|nr:MULTISPECIES: hypothetical protein [Roseobacteraceae]MBU2960881.1 hypothetical protein [Citreicella sp. C3M06]MDO6584395.1 hypothetical protein [Salipiger sp. 1_MG-2023]
MRKLVFLALLPVLASCDAATQDQIARNAARSTVNKVVLQRYPSVPVEPALNCVIDNANAQQIYALASESVTGPTQSSVEIVTVIVSKPETLTCLAAEGLPALIR